ncbi:hypothetical protein V8E54_000471 [Elaphomyces granulatus]
MKLPEAPQRATLQAGMRLTTSASSNPPPAPTLSSGTSRSSVSYHYRSLPAQAEARRHQATIRRANRASRRAGEEVESTPTIQALQQPFRPPPSRSQDSLAAVGTSSEQTPGASDDPFFIGDRTPFNVLSIFYAPVPRSRKRAQSGSESNLFSSYFACTLSRVKSLQGLYLLQPVTLSDLNGKLDKLLVQEDERITQLATSTEIAWEQIEATAEFRYGRAYRMERAAQ